MIGDLQGDPRKSPADQEYMPFGCNTLNKALLDYARTHLNETEEAKKKALEEIREFVKKDLNVKIEIPDIAYLIFLRTSKFDVPKACCLIKRCVDFVENHNYLFNRTDSDVMRRTVESKVVGILPYRDANARAIVYVRTECWKPEELKAEDLIFGCISSLHVVADNPVNQVVGFIVIIDFKNLRIQQVVAMSKWLIVGLQALQRCVPFLLKEFHIVHTPPLFRTMWKVLKPFISEKIKKRIIFYKSSHWDSLHRRISPKILPQDLGGQLAPYSYEHWVGDITDIEKKYYIYYNLFLNRHKGN